MYFFITALFNTHGGAMYNKRKLLVIVRLQEEKVLFSTLLLQLSVMVIKNMKGNKQAVVSFLLILLPRTPCA